MIRKIKKQKKGLSSTEMVLSFLIFIGFLFFLFYFLNPFKETSVPSSLLDMVEEKIKEKIETDLIKQTLNLNDNVIINEDCFSIPIVDGGKDKFVVVKNEQKQKIKAEKSLSRVKIENSGKFYEVYYSEDLTSLTGLRSCTSLEETDYEIGLIKKSKVFSMKKISELKEKYKKDYNNLKEELDIPGNNDFSFFIYTIKGELILDVEKNIPKGVDVLADTESIDVLLDNGDIVKRVLKIKVW